MGPESDSLKIGRLEDKFNLYEPILISLQGVASIPAEITKMQSSLQVLRDSSVAVKEQLITLFKSQDRAYKETVRSLEEQTRVLEKEIAECPIADIVSRVIVIERDMDVVDALDDRLHAAEKCIGIINGLDDRVDDVQKTIESFKLKGWDLLFRIVPWVLALVASGYIVLGP